MKIQMLFIALLCAAVVGCAPASSPNNMTCDFLRNGDSVQIVVTNTSKEDMDIYIPFDRDAGNGAPSFVIAKITDASGTVLTQNTLNKDGYWSRRYLDSTFLIPPVKMQRLKSGESVAGTAKLSKISQGLGKEIRVQKTDLVKLRVMIFLDSSLKTSMTFESKDLDGNQPEETN